MHAGFFSGDNPGILENVELHYGSFSRGVCWAPGHAPIFGGPLAVEKNINFWTYWRAPSCGLNGRAVTIYNWASGSEPT